jgi:hypothetical protein
VTTQQTQATHHTRRAVDRLERLVANGERLLAEHIKRMEVVETERGRYLAHELLDQLSRTVELMRTRLEAEERQRTNNRHPMYYFIARRAAD